MLPVVANIVNPTPVQTNLVATPIPDNTALRVPVDNVPPSVSNAQINNNTRGNGNAVVIKAEQATATTTEGDAFIVPTARSLSNGSHDNAQTGFITQILSQDELAAQPPAVLKSILEQYEKIVVRSYVKYKPSNATLPPPPPPGILGSVLLQQQDSAPAVDNRPTEELLEVAQENRAASQSFINENEIVSLVKSPVPALAASAYAATSARNAKALEAPVRASAPDPALPSELRDPEAPSS
ncbi:MAG: hypothetical protein SFT92_03020 [Rickettsiales bacterium]|nr:hypothetical protein [Rickettsiales bacterium]